MECHNIWCEDFAVRNYEVDVNGRVTIQTVCNWLQTVADNHAFQLGFSLEQMRAMELCWVLSRLQVRMFFYPGWRETARLITWPSGTRKLFAYRDFQVLDRDGKLLGVATSDWLILNAHTLRPTVIPPHIQEVVVGERPRAIPEKAPKIPALERADAECRFRVRLSDLDINRHVNNVNYIEWAIESIPEPVRRGRRLSDLNASFRAASGYGDVIVAQSRRIGAGDLEVFTHRLSREADGVALTEVMTSWAATEPAPPLGPA